MKKRKYERLIYSRDLNDIKSKNFFIDTLSHAELFNRLVKVLKGSCGDVFSICIPGQFLFDAEICSIKKSRVELSIISYDFIDSHDNSKLFLAQSIPKKDFKECVFLAAQAGFTDLIPLISEFSMNKKDKIRIEKFQKIADHACEIARDPIGCIIHEPLQLKNFLDSRPLEFDNIIFLDPKGKTCLKDVKYKKSSLFIAGAEGGFSKMEKKMIYSTGALDICMGQRVLPAVSAAAFAAFSYIQMK